MIGGGGSFLDNLDYARNFDGKIFATDIIAMDLIKNGIIPDYIGTYEISEGIMTETFDMELSNYSKHFTVYWNVCAKNELRRRLSGLRFKHIPISLKYKFINNVGLFCVYVAKEILKADEIHLIAMDHEGKGAKNQEYPEEYYQVWVQGFKDYMPYLGETRIINATGRGRLYFEGIIPFKKTN